MLATWILRCREGLDAPEASDELSAVRFKPTTLQYQYFTDVGPSISFLHGSAAIPVRPTAFELNAITTPPTFFYEPSSNEVASFFLDCEPSERALSDYTRSSNTTREVSDHASLSSALEPRV
jgi:hypothetical protein